MNNELKLCYADIINGYSFNTFYIKHFGLKDDSYLQRKYFYFYNVALSKGVLSEKDTLIELQKQKIWTKEQEYLDQIDFIKNMEIALTKIRNPIDKEMQEAEITKQKAKLTDLFEERHNALKLTAESYANSKILECYLYAAFFKDPHLKERVYSESDLENLEEEEVRDKINLYNESINKYDGKLFRNLGFSNYVLNHICMTNSLFEFYGKPLVDLTFFQISLYSNGLNYKNIITKHGQPPQEIADNPEDIVEWANSMETKQESKPDISQMLKDKSSINFREYIKSDPRNSRIIV